MFRLYVSGQSLVEGMAKELSRGSSCAASYMKGREVAAKKPTVCACLWYSLSELDESINPLCTAIITKNPFLKVGMGLATLLKTFFLSFLLTRSVQGKNSPYSLTLLKRVKGGNLCGLSITEMVGS